MPRAALLVGAEPPAGAADAAAVTYCPEAASTLRDPPCPVAPIVRSMRRKPLRSYKRMAASIPVKVSR